MLLVASSSEVIRNKATQSEKSGEKIAEIIFVYKEFFYIIRVANAITGLFFLLVLEQDKANLAHARLKLAQIASEKKLGPLSAQKPACCPNPQCGTGDLNPDGIAATRT